MFGKFYFEIMFFLEIGCIVDFEFWDLLIYWSFVLKVLIFFCDE